LQENYSKKSPI